MVITILKCPELVIKSKFHELVLKDLPDDYGEDFAIWARCRREKEDTSCRQYVNQLEHSRVNNNIVVIDHLNFLACLKSWKTL